MSKELTRQEAVEELLHHLRGHVLEAVMKDYKEGFQISLYFKYVTGRLMTQIGDVLDRYKPPASLPQPTTRK